MSQDQSCINLGALKGKCREMRAVYIGCFKGKVSQDQSCIYCGALKGKCREMRAVYS